MKKRSRSSVIVIFIALLFCCSSALEVIAATKMPSFALESVQGGKVVHSSSFKGKVLLLTFFATWCPPCAQEVPVLNRLHEEFAGAGFSVVGLSVDQQGTALVARFVKKKSIKYPVLMAEPATTIDFGGVYGIPVAFLVNKSGNVVKKYTGYVEHTILEKDVKSLLD
ncbi:MAG: cytochrome c biogenesis protein (TlpA) [Desulfotalea sp.]|nr:MAG: cytochrome c biogenesis protein (TlpA) [Desulfotalea sp.]